MKLFYLTVLNLFLIIHALSVRADYSPIPLNYLILEADIAVYGEIDSIAGDYFFLKIKNKIFGKYDNPTIKVKKFRNWRCAERWTKYDVGQNVFLFLKKDLKKHWSIISGGGEGELPIVKDKLYLHATYSMGMPFVYYDEIDKSSGKRSTYKFEVFEIFGAKFSGIELKLIEFSEAVAGIRTCFRLAKGKSKADDKITETCTNENIAIFKSKSKLNNWLAETCVKL